MKGGRKGQRPAVPAKVPAEWWAKLAAASGVEHFLQFSQRFRTILGVGVGARQIQAVEHRTIRNGDGAFEGRGGFGVFVLLQETFAEVLPGRAVGRLLGDDFGIRGGGFGPFRLIE